MEIGEDTEIVTIPDKVEDRPIPIELPIEIEMPELVPLIPSESESWN